MDRMKKVMQKEKLDTHFLLQSSTTFMALKTQHTEKYEYVTFNDYTTFYKEIERLEAILENRH